MKPRIYNDDKTFISCPAHKRMYNAGIPREYWSLVQTRSPKFSGFDLGRGKLVSGVVQRNTFKGLCNETRRNHPLVVCFSGPTDNGALVVGYSLLDSYAETNYATKCRDMSHPFVFLKKYPKLFLFHNILVNATMERIQDTRDMLLKFRYAFRVVVITGKPKVPSKWFQETFGVRPTYCFMADDNATKIGGL